LIMPSTLPPDTRRRYQRRPPRWAAEAARTLGLRPSTVEAAVHGPRPIHQQVAELVRAALRWGDPKLVGKLLAPIDDARRGAAPPVFTAQLIHEVQMADLTEDQQESAFRAEPGPLARHAWLIALRIQHARTGDLIRALENLEESDD
jgi:hypothetical protein